MHNDCNLCTQQTGYLYVFDRTKSDIVTYALTGVSNTILMTTNVFFIYNVWTVYWRMAKLPYVQVLIIVSITVASIDIVYRLMLLKWCLQKVVTTSQKGVQNTEVPPKKIPVHCPRLHQRHLDDQNVVAIPVYQVHLIDRHRLQFLGRHNIILFAHQPLHHPPQNHQGHNLVVFTIIHYIDNYGHFNQLVE